MPILAFVARQLDVSPASWRDYARRDETRRTHLADLSRRFGHRVFSRADFHALVAFAMPIAQTTTRPSRLAGIVIDEMRRRRLLLPPVTVVEAIVRRALSVNPNARRSTPSCRDATTKARPGSHGCATRPCRRHPAMSCD
ncbi:DUF4158 domain-containing protein [Brevundimonas sp.]|uniref:DUF4158 domain-containing protein n=1 Tax=Brevundimonas sp. TaxID=1871086 RepID=UPI00345A3987